MEVALILFPDPTKHPAWLRGQTSAWCDQLAAQTGGRYDYTWNSAVLGEAAEDVFTRELAKLVRGRTLDVGCGHGAYTNRWAAYADEVTGYDMTEGFLATANRAHRAPNVRYVLGNAHDGLPFEDGYFDLAYTKKGPTGWYPEACRILRPGADVLALHPGDGNGEGGELGSCFPGLFAPPATGTPTLDRIKQRLAESGLIVRNIRVLRETVCIPSARDVLTLLCFGQSEAFARWAETACYADIERQFERHRGPQGLVVTGFYYLLHAQAPASAPDPAGERRQGGMA